MKALLLIGLVLALPARAEDVPDRLSLTAADVSTSDGRQLQLVGGCWLSEKVCVDTGKELTDLRAENSSLKAQAGSPTLGQLLVAALVGLAVGAGATYAAMKLGK